MNNIDQRTYRVRFTDCRARRTAVRTELTLDAMSQTWRGEQGDISALILDDARLMICEGQTRGGVWPFDLVTYEVMR